MITVTEVQQRIQQTCAPMPSEQVGLAAAYGRIAAADHLAMVSHPPVDVSAMDGYAVKMADTTIVPARLKLAGASTAGDAPDQMISAGEAMRIFTGASVPAGADSIAIQENVSVSEDGTITVQVAPTQGRYIRKAGQDFHKGETGVAKGDVLNPRRVGLLAAMNHASVEVYRQPRIGILATGNELQAPGSELKPGEIVSSNSHALAGFILRWGGVPVDLGTARDTPESLLEAVDGIESRVDMLVVTGGASVGDHDLVRPVLGRAGLELNLWKIAMRPGKPLGFGTFRGLPFFSLPGNPVSSSVCAILFLRTAIKSVLNQPIELPFREVVNGRDLPANDEREDYLRATINFESTGQLIATAFNRQDSGMYATFVKADALLRRPVHADALAAGEKVSIVLLDDMS